MLPTLADRVASTVSMRVYVQERMVVGKPMLGLLRVQYDPKV
jgi:hypothetical protein